MATKIRLRRMGRKKHPVYRVVVAEESFPRQGKFADDLGYYDPMVDPAKIQINEEKAMKWLKNGAEPTETVRSLLSKLDILKKFHEQTHSIKKEETPSPPARGSEQTDSGKEEAS